MQNDGKYSKKTRVVHCKISPYDIYIGRGSPWGNPFSHKEDSVAEFIVASREEAIESYRIWIQKQPQLLKQLHTLKAKTLGCWCKHPSNPLSCHGDILAEMADALPEPAIEDILEDLR